MIEIWVKAKDKDGKILRELILEFEEEPSVEQLRERAVSRAIEEKIYLEDQREYFSLVSKFSFYARKEGLDLKQGVFSLDFDLNRPRQIMAEYEEDFKEYKKEYNRNTIASNRLRIASIAFLVISIPLYPLLGLAAAIAAVALSIGSKLGSNSYKPTGNPPQEPSPSIKLAAEKLKLVGKAKPATTTFGPIPTAGFSPDADPGVTSATSTVSNSTAQVASPAPGAAPDPKRHQKP